jgi:hypothetical protein
LNARQQQVEWRRDRVLELSSQGFNQSDISTVLHVDKSIISRDMAHLRHKAQENLKQHIHQTIPEEYQKACNTLNQVLRMTWSIISKTEDEKTKLQALTLINDVNKYRTELVTNGVIVNDSLRVIQSKMDKLSINTNTNIIHKLDDKIESINEEIEEEKEKEEESTTNGIF